MIAKNDIFKRIVRCEARLGSSFFTSQVSSHKNSWEVVYTTDHDNYEVYTSVRHPIERFRSYFAFWEGDKKWTMTFVKNYFANFKHSDNVHTQFQSFFDYGNTKYFEMVYLQNFLNIPKYKQNKVKVNLNWYNKCTQTPKEVVDFINIQTKKTYKEDIIWYNNLKKCEFPG